MERNRNDLPVSLSPCLSVRQKKGLPFLIPVVLMRNKSGNRSLLSNGVARTHFMPPDGACILTVLKPLQSLTGGSRFEALAKSAPDETPRDRDTPAPRVERDGYSALSIFAYSYLRYFLCVAFSE
jgi:hypothetical protein